MVSEPLLRPRVHHPASYAWRAFVHTESMNTKVLRSTISTDVTANVAMPNRSIEADTQRRDTFARSVTAVPPLCAPHLKR